MHLCDECDQEYEPTTRKGGRPQRFCSRACQVKAHVVYQRAWYRANHDRQRAAQARQYADRCQLLRDIKMESGCVDCGYRGHPAALQFDHVRGVKEFQVAVKAASVTMERLLAEIAKCDVRCANCHLIATYDRRRGLRL